MKIFHHVRRDVKVRRTCAALSSKRSLSGSRERDRLLTSQLVSAVFSFFFSRGTHTHTHTHIHARRHPFVCPSLTSASSASHRRLVYATIENQKNLSLRTDGFGLAIVVGFLHTKVFAWRPSRVCVNRQSTYCIHITPEVA